MLAILIHFLGHLVIDSSIPPWIGSADAYALAMWFAAFALVDLIACVFADGYRLRVILGISAAWSFALVGEQIMLRDNLQSADGIIQNIIDLSLVAYFILILFRMRKGKELSA